MRTFKFSTVPNVLDVDIATHHDPYLFLAHRGLDGWNDLGRGYGHHVVAGLRGQPAHLHPSDGF